MSDHDTACTCDHCRMTVAPQSSTAPPAFTRELLEVIVARRSAAGDYYTQDTNALAAFALTLMAERDEARRELAEAEEAIRLYADVYPHSAPHDCFATGPLTGDPIRDLFLCPGCECENHPAVRRALERKP